MSLMRVRAFGRQAGSLFVACLVLSVGLVAWFARERDPISIRALVLDDGMLAPKGRWFVLFGSNGNRHKQVFLFDFNSGRLAPLGAASNSCHAPVFSADGRHVAWARTRRRLFGRKSCGLFLADLGQEVRIREISLPVGADSELALSPDGGLIAALDQDALVVVESGSGKRVAQISVASDLAGHVLVFSDAGHLRLYPRQRHFREANQEGVKREKIQELEIATGRVSATGHVDSEFPGLRLRPNASGTRLLALDRRRTKVTLRDGRTGELLARLPTDAEEVRDFSGHPRGKLRTAAFLAEGRIAAVLSGGAASTSTVRVYSDSGSIERTLELHVSDQDDAVILGEPARGTLLVALSERRDQRDVWHLFLVNLASGKVLSHTEGLKPLDLRAFWFAPALRPSENESWRFFLDPSGSLIQRDPFSGEMRTIVGDSRDVPTATNQ